MKADSFLIDLNYWLSHHVHSAHSFALDGYGTLFGRPFEYKGLEKKVDIGTLILGVTNVCNARCIFCVYKNTVEKKGVMPFEIFKKAIDEYVQLGGTTVSFTPVIGEPLLDPGLIRKIKYAVKKPGIKYIAFYTNGILLLKGGLYKKLIDSGIHEIKISTAGTDRKMFEEVYGTNQYGELIKGIKALLEYNKKTGEKVKIALHFRSSKKPSAIVHSPDFEKYVAPYLSNRVTYEFLINYDNWAGEITQKDLKGVMRLRRFPIVKVAPCTRTFEYIAVLFDGSVRICNCRIKKTEFDDLVVGNIKQTPLKELFYVAAAPIRESFPKNELRVACQYCSLYVPATKRWLQRRTKKDLLKSESV